jgi:hypothetical protein
VARPYALRTRLQMSDSVAFLKTCSYIHSAVEIVDECLSDSSNVQLVCMLYR